jgi:hypothetical protein
MSLHPEEAASYNSRVPQETKDNAMLLRTPEAAKRLGVSPGFLEKARHYGNGPAFAKLGRLVVYRPDDLDAWVAAQIVGSTSESPKGAAR